MTGFISGRMDSNHRYPAPKAGAIAARRRPVTEREYMENRYDGQLIIFRIIDEYYPEDISFLPVISPFRFLVTVMLSASTTDRQAAAAAERLFSAYPSAEDIASASREDIKALIASAGLSEAKSRNIKQTSAIIARDGIPETLEELVRLPGVGEKTAACYLVTILNKPGVIADTHFVRVARRLGFTDTEDRTKSAREIRERYPEDIWARLSMTLNLHGRTFCKAKPVCQGCPVSALCPSREAFAG